jgi:hypothetical protein
MKNLFFSILLINCFYATAQQSEQISFEENVHDFGVIKEVDGSAEYEFKFINNGAQPITILNVKASCGCTTPGWSKEAIAPGEAGYIKAKYNTKNRPGPFNKSLTVTTDNETEKTKRLYIKGQVTPKPKSIEEEFPQVVGALRVKYQSFNLGKVKMTDEPTVKKYEVYNASDSIVTFLDQVDKPKYIEVSFDPVVMPAKSKGTITLTYDAKNRNDYGFVSDNVVIHTDEELNGDKSFSVYATLEEAFPTMSKEEWDQAPILKMENTIHDFGKIQQGEKVTATFTLTNEGKSDLNIRKAKSTCGCVITKLKKNTIKPGKSMELELTFDATDRRGIQQKSVSIFTNDPKRPAQRVTIKASVQQ